MGQINTTSACGFFLYIIFFFSWDGAVWDVSLFFLHFFAVLQSSCLDSVSPQLSFCLSSHVSFLLKAPKASHGLWKCFLSYVCDVNMNSFLSYFLLLLLFSHWGVLPSFMTTGQIWISLIIPAAPYFFKSFFNIYHLTHSDVMQQVNFSTFIPRSFYSVLNLFPSCLIQQEELLCGWVNLFFCVLL